MSTSSLHPDSSQDVIRRCSKQFMSGWETVGESQLSECPEWGCIDCGIRQCKEWSDDCIGGPICSLAVNFLSSSTELANCFCPLHAACCGATRVQFQLLEGACDLKQVVCQRRVDFNANHSVNVHLSQRAG